MKIKDYIRQLSDDELVNFLMEFHRQKLIDEFWCSDNCPNRIKVDYLGQKSCKLDLEINHCPYEDDKEVLKVWIEHEVGENGIEINGLPYINYD